MRNVNHTLRLLLIALAVASASAASAHGADNALLAAVKKSDSATVRRLLQEGTSANVSEVDGSTALHWAVEADDVEMIRLLLRAGADAKIANRYGMTPLHLAAVNGNAAVIRDLLDAGADPNAVLPEGETVLMTAARTGSAKSITLLIERGAKVDAREKWYGESALMWAAAENHADAVSVLLEHGAPVDARSTLLKTANRRAGQNILSLGNWTPVMYAARENALDAGRALIKARADLNLTDPDGATALVIAIINANYEFASLLLDAGADPDIVDSDAGMGALYAAVDMHRLAVGHGRPNPQPVGLMTAVDIVRKLLAKGADPNIKLKKAIMQRHHTAGDSALGQGATPFLRAAKSGDIAMMRALVEGGADPGIAMPSGVSALLFAAGQGWRNGSPAAPSYDQGSDEEAVEAIRYLLDLGFDIQSTNDTGDSPLHVAISGRGSEAIIKFLVSQGADIDAKNKRGQTPLALADSKGNDAITSLLRPNSGTDPK
ncbi:MAG TPA: ankyrin repeat domain-containing protein [Terriglobia bacterium]|nr:ankyrin repeat domain-containing protein [Terriglobia bacterium]